MCYVLGGASVNKIVKYPCPHRRGWTTRLCKSNDCYMLWGEHAMTKEKNGVKGIMDTGGTWVAIFNKWHYPFRSLDFQTLHHCLLWKGHAVVSSCVSWAPGVVCLLSVQTGLPSFPWFVPQGARNAAKRLVPLRGPGHVLGWCWCCSQPKPQTLFHRNTCQPSLVFLLISFYHWVSEPRSSTLYLSLWFLIM